MVKKIVLTVAALSGLVAHIFSAFLQSSSIQNYVDDSDYYSSKMSETSVDIDSKINSIIRSGRYQSVSQNSSGGYDWTDLGQFQLYIMDISELYRLIHQQGVIGSLIVGKSADTVREDNNVVLREYYDGFKPHVEKFAELSEEYSDRWADLENFRDRSAELVSSFKSQDLRNLDSGFDRELSKLMQDAFDSKVLALGEGEEPIDFVNRFTDGTEAIVSAYADFADEHADFVEERNSLFDYFIAVILLIAGLAPWFERKRDDGDGGQSVDAIPSS